MKVLYDVCIVGGGIVGLTLARTLLRSRPSLRLALVEKETELAQHQTRWSSGVVHAGIYYTPGSQRARLCVEGARKMEEYCVQNNLPYEKCGKLIVATNEDEIPRLEELMRRGIANGVRDLVYLDSHEIKSVEPNIKGLKAIHSPHTGITDFRKVALHVATEVQQMSGDIRLGFQVSGYQNIGRGRIHRIFDESGEFIDSSSVITCCGLFSDRVSQMMYGQIEPAIIPFRGDYMQLKSEYTNLVRGLVYPVPDPNLPFLGVHFTKMVDGSVTMGPTAALAFEREGYSLFKVGAYDLWDSLKNRGLQTMLGRYWKETLYQTFYVFFPELFVRDLQKYMPNIEGSHLIKGHSGVRAQAMMQSGRFHDDFVFDKPEGKAILHVRNAPSPAATSSFAIAEHIAREFEGVLSAS